MIDNAELKAKLTKELKKLKLTEEQENLMVNELNYLSNLLIDIYMTKEEGGDKTND